MENFPKIGKVNEKVKRHLHNIAIQFHADRAGLCVVKQESPIFLRVKDCWVWPNYTNIAPGTLIENNGWWDTATRLGDYIMTHPNQIPSCWTSAKHNAKLYDIASTIILRVEPDVYFFLDATSPKPEWDYLTAMSVRTRIMSVEKETRKFFPLTVKTRVAEVISYLSTHPEDCEAIYKHYFPNQNIS